MRPAVFLDKDGTLIDDVPFNVDPARIRLARGATTGLARLAAAGYALVVVSNQSGVALGRFPATALDGVARRIDALLAPAGIAIEDWRFCAHAPGDGCDCRKPRPGMLVRAARERGLDLARSWMVGDILDDIEAGHRAGCAGCVLIDNGNETLWDLRGPRLPDVVAPDLDAAARRLLARAGAAREPERSGA
jgi:histidinol-phosphate phosphatase family protein